MPTLDEVRVFLAGRGIPVLEFAQPTPTAASAARAVGCSVAEIAKTVVFLVGETPVAVVTSGDAKVRGAKLKRATGLTGKVRLPDAGAVQRLTGYTPGGVCPFLLPDGLRIVVDSSLRRFATVYPAAGNDHSGVPISVAALLSVTGGEEADVSERPLPEGGG